MSNPAPDVVSVKMMQVPVRARNEINSNGSSHGRNGSYQKERTREVRLYSLLAHEDNNAFLASLHVVLCGARNLILSERAAHFALRSHTVSATTATNPESPSQEKEGRE